MANTKNTNVSIKNLEIQAGQLTKQLQNNYVGFSATTKENPKANSSVIITRSGLVIPDRVTKKKVETKKKEKKSTKGDQVVQEPPKTKSQITKEEKSTPKTSLAQEKPYHHMPMKKDKERHYAYFLEIFKQLNIIIPFSEALELIHYSPNS